MHRIEYVCNRPRNSKLSALEFLKYLLISQDFLRASQFYRVYQFVIVDYCSDDNKFSVSTTNHVVNFRHCAAPFKLTLEDIRTWNRLLNVQYANLCKYERKYAEEFSAVSRIFTGHISLDLFDDRDNDINHGGIIRQIQKQLYYLRCHAKTLIFLWYMHEFVFIDCCCFFDNLDEFKEVIALHQFKRIRAANFCEYSSRFNATIDDDFFCDFPTSPTVEKLNFVWLNLGKNHDLISKITKMMPFFPNLVELTSFFQVKRYTHERFTLKKLLVWIREECKKIDKLQEANLSIPRTTLLYEFRIHIPKTRKVVEHFGWEILTTTKFNTLCSAEHSIPEPKDSTNYVLIKQYCEVELQRIQPNFDATLRFIIEMDPLKWDDDDKSDDESTEDESDHEWDWR
ncbi:hypothetical protein M3Y96_00730700 [Aphelenchoides besseyi]|nr:hypothetical protein M3Y96_00730700 [Aphelenchoides besseyi]